MLREIKFLLENLREKKTIFLFSQTEHSDELHFNIKF